MRQTLALQLSFTAVVVGMLLGCSNAPFDVAPVHGKITLDGQPLKAGKVMFAPIRKGADLEAGKPAIGVIREDGTFELSTYRNGDGAVVGEHWVTVFGPDTPTVLSPTTSPVSTATATFDRISITERQSVKSGTDNQIEIALTSNDLANFSARAD
jgi:hypothetical protein